jgi:hypothetical protein
MKELMSDMPMPLRERFAEIVDLTDKFCVQHLNNEYGSICRKLAMAVCRAGALVTTGKPTSWACGIVYSAGWVNFLTDPNNSPHMRTEDIAKGFGVSLATMQAKFKMIRDTLELIPLQPEYSLPSMAEENPLVWIAEVNGLLVDLRHAPRVWQEKAFRQGMIPYIPADRQRRVKK